MLRRWGDLELQRGAGAVGGGELEDLREDLENYDYALELPWLDYGHIVPDDPEDDELETEVAF